MDCYGRVTEAKFLPPANEVYIFTGICHSVNRGWVLPGRPPCQVDPPARETPLQGDPLPRRPPRRPPNQRDPLPGRFTLQSHTQGGNWGGSGPGPQPTGELRGIRSRRTPKGGNWGGSDPGPHPKGKFRRIRTRPPHDNYCCGWYTSYWNAFLISDMIVFLYQFISSFAHKILKIYSERRYFLGLQLISPRMFN